MSQGIFIKGKRPQSKKAIKEAVQNDPTTVRAEATSMFGNEFGGTITELPQGTTVTFCGPDPYTSRKFYGTISRSSSGKLVVS